MGNKIITEKDFWMCSGGLMPTQFQSVQPKAKKIGGEKYITKMDTATVGFADFSCKKLMLVMAIIAAIIAVAVVATGGAALIAIGALAGAAGAALGAVAGSLICGQMVAKVRLWDASKSNFQILGIDTITGDHTMTCPLFGDKITFAPQIKSWSQALALGGANLLGKIFEGMMAGAAVGMSAAVISGGASALASGGLRGLGQAALQFGKSIPMNIAKNWLASNAFRPITALQAGMQHYGETGNSGWGAAGSGLFAAETGTAESARKLLTGQGSWEDVVGLAMWLTPVHENLKGEEAPKVEEPVKGEEPANGKNEEAPKNEEEAPKVEAAPEEKAPASGDGEAYADGGDAKIEAPDSSNHFDENGNLKPNTTYTTGEFGYTYQTDGLGRIMSAKADILQLSNVDRLPHNPNTPGKLSGDHAGHLYGDRFGGSPELDNLVSQAQSVNLSDFKKIENQWAKALNEVPPKAVSVDIKINYIEGSMRPSSFEVNYKIDGEQFTRTITQ